MRMKTRHFFDLMTDDSFDTMFSLESDKMTTLWPNDIPMAYQTEQLLLNKFFDSMLSSKSEKITSVTKWPLNFYFLCHIFK